MKRIILFRGFSESLNKWVEGDLIQCEINKKWILPIEINSLTDIIPVHPDSVGQFTGLCDKNADKIFEGMRVRITGEVLGEVLYRNGSFVVENSNGEFWHLHNWRYPSLLKITSNLFKP